MNIDRSKLTDHIISALPDLTDGALDELAVCVDGLPRRGLTSESLAAEQRAREQAAPCASFAYAERELHDAATDAATVIGARTLPYDPTLQPGYAERCRAAEEEARALNAKRELCPDSELWPGSAALRASTRSL